MRVLIYQTQAILEKYPIMASTSSSSSHQNRLHIIKLLHEKFNLINDTHTADGFKAAFDHFDQSEEIPMVVLENCFTNKV